MHKSEAANIKSTVPGLHVHPSEFQKGASSAVLAVLQASREKYKSSCMTRVKANIKTGIATRGSQVKGAPLHKDPLLELEDFDMTSDKTMDAANQWWWEILS